MLLHLKIEAEPAYETSFVEKVLDDEQSPKKEIVSAGHLIVLN